MVGGIQHKHTKKEMIFISLLIIVSIIGIVRSYRGMIKHAEFRGYERGSWFTGMYVMQYKELPSIALRKDAFEQFDPQTEKELQRFVDIRKPKHHVLGNLKDEDRSFKTVLQKEGENTFHGVVFSLKTDENLADHWVARTVTSAYDNAEGAYSHLAMLFPDMPTMRA